MNHAAFLKARATAFPSRGVEEAILRILTGRPAKTPPCAATALRATMNKLTEANAERLLPRVRECLASDPGLAAPVLGYAAGNAGVAGLLVRAVDPSGEPARAFLSDLEARLARAPDELSLPSNAEEDYDAFCATLACKAGLIGSCRVARLLRGETGVPALRAAAERGIFERGNAFASEVLLQCLSELGCAGAELRRRITSDKSLPFKLRFLAERM